MGRGLFGLGLNDFQLIGFLLILTSVVEDVTGVLLAIGVIQLLLGLALIAYGTVFVRHRR